MGGGCGQRWEMVVAVVDKTVAGDNCVGRAMAERAALTFGGRGIRNRTRGDIYRTFFA